MICKNLLDPEVLPYLYECAKKNDFAIVTYDGEYVLTEKPDDEYVLKEALLNVMKIKKVDNFLDLKLITSLLKPVTLFRAYP